MDFSDASRQFQWQDRYGLVWDIYVYDDDTLISWFARPRYDGYIGGTNLAHVSTHTFDPLRKLPKARLLDVQVDRYLENRGTGSMLVGEAIEECKRRGHMGIEGKISSVDSDHFDKLKHFYEKLGFSVVFYEPEHPDYRPGRVGKIEMLFSQF